MKNLSLCLKKLQTRDLKEQLKEYMSFNWNAKIKAHISKGTPLSQHSIWYIVYGVLFSFPKKLVNHVSVLLLKQMRVNSIMTAVVIFQYFINPSLWFCQWRSLYGTVKSTDARHQNKNHNVLSIAIQITCPIAKTHTHSYSLI